jgi:iron complex outermembrane receptor protein
VAAQVPVDSTRADTLRAATDTVVFELEDLRATAPRPLATATGSSAVRLSLDIPRVSTVPILAEALREMPFFEVRENSRGEAQLTLRGTESRQVAVLVDGIPLTLGWDARTDLSLIPVGAAREIQLYRGLSSVLHGPNVLGGVVDIDIVRGPLKIDLPPPLRLEGGVDHTGAVSLGGQVGATLRPGGRELVLRGGVGYRTRDGVPLASGVDQPGDAVDGRRLNSDLEHLSGFFAARYGNDGGFWASLSSFGFTAERGRDIQGGDRVVGRHRLGRHAAGTGGSGVYAGPGLRRDAD